MWLRKGINLSLFLLALGIVGACKDAFDYSPYAANVEDKYKNIDVKNFAKLFLSDTLEKEEFKIAVIADNHYRYHELDEAIVNINSREDIDVVIADGDITDHGYLKEYELFYKRMKDLNCPYLTVIGNHDYRSNGGKIYKDIYGEYNKVFSYNNSLFVLFDDVFWESNKDPDFNWLEEQLKNSSQYNYVFVICHIPPYDRQFTDEYEELYKNLMLNYNVDLSVHGHIHSNKYGDYYGDGMIYLAVEDIMDKGYSIITVNNSGIIVDNIRY